MASNDTSQYQCTCKIAQYSDAACKTATVNITMPYLYNTCGGIQYNSTTYSGEYKDSCKTYVQSKTSSNCADTTSYKTDGSDCIPAQTGSGSMRIECPSTPDVKSAPSSNVCRCSVTTVYSDDKCTNTTKGGMEAAYLKNVCYVNTKYDDNCQRLVSTGLTCAANPTVTKAGDCVMLAPGNYYKYNCVSGAATLVPSLVVLLLAAFAVIGF
eukprot:TRINITY_DN14259_c0_g1_i1.p1 TRINITY_DN14259_c0_g1~~TRINITY_DN14259_c0_g1_i1.p1  ORF type:complete len:247 (-),score=23.35 TRINITY_DN14259_c0_g1_i1:83-715(-)